MEQESYNPYTDPKSVENEIQLNFIQDCLETIKLIPELVQKWVISKEIWEELSKENMKIWDRTNIIKAYMYIFEAIPKQLKEWILTQTKAIELKNKEPRSAYEWLNTNKNANEMINNLLKEWKITPEKFQELNLLDPYKKRDEARKIKVLNK